MQDIEAIKAEARQVVDLIDELMDEDVTGKPVDHGLFIVYPHANLLIAPPPLAVKFWRGFLWALAVTLAVVLVVWLSVRAL